MTTEQKIIYLLQYHEQLTREYQATCFDMDEDNQEYSAYLKAKLQGERSDRRVTADGMHAILAS